MNDSRRCARKTDRLWRSHSREHQNTQGGEPGAKIKITPVRSPPKTQESSLLRWWPAMRAHPTWQRPLGVTSLFFPLVWPSQHKHLACYMFLPCSHFRPLRSNNYRNFIRIIITKSCRRRTRQSSRIPRTRRKPPPSSPSRQLQTTGESPRSAGRHQISNGSDSPGRQIWRSRSKKLPPRISLRDRRKLDKSLRTGNLRNR